MTTTYASIDRPDIATLLAHLRAELTVAAAWLDQHQLEKAGLCRCLRTNCQAAERAQLWHAHLLNRIDYYDNAVDSPTKLLPLIAL